MDKLGIYIPTYNRPAELEECLNSFIPQLKPFGFPIYISDNSTNDETEKLVMKIKKRYPKVYYRKNVYMKYGRVYATNLKSVLEMGNTEFVWFFSDDDVIKKNAITTIIRFLDNNCFLQLNREDYSKNLKKKIGSRIIKKYKNEIYKNAELALLNTENNEYQGYMAHIIAKKKFVDLEMDSVDITKKNMDFLHTIILYRGISIAKSQGVFIAKPLIKNRTDNISYSNRIMEIFFRSWDITHNMLEGRYPYKVIEKVRKRPLKRLVMLIFISKTTSKNLGYLPYIYNAKVNIFYKVILSLVALVPKSIVVIIKKKRKQSLN